MAHEIEMKDDGVVHISFIGDIDLEAINAYAQDLTPYLEAASETNKVCMISHSGREGRFSSDARRCLMELNQDPRVGRVGVLGGNRFNRVMTNIILKATGRENIRFFDNEKEALIWLKEE